MKCANCGNEIVSNASVCNLCGMPIKKKKMSTGGFIASLVAGGCLIWIIGVAIMTSFMIMIGDSGEPVDITDENGDVPETGYLAYVEETRVAADTDLLDCVYTACVIATSDPSIKEKPRKGERGIEITDDTDWGRDVMESLGIQSMDELEWMSVAAEGEMLIERTEDGDFFIRKGEIEGLSL